VLFPDVYLLRHLETTDRADSWDVRIMKGVTISKEGWVEFTRFKCKEGFIDCWTGDLINNPNNYKKSTWCVNSMSTYYRFNEKGKWISSNEFKDNFMDILMKTKNILTANELCELLKR